MASSLKPMGDRVVVKPKGREETTKSGIVLPDGTSYTGGLVLPKG